MKYLCTDNMELGPGKVVAYSKPAPYRASEPTTDNEDSYLVLPLTETSAVIAVADGMGGTADGKIASTLAIESIREACGSRTANPLALREPILDAIELCNSELLSQGTGTGTTIAVVEVQGSTIRSYHAGDSTVMVVGQRGVLKLQTISHSPVAMAVESGYMAQDDIALQQDRHWLSNHVGSLEMRIEIGPPTDLAHFDTLLVCSDGLTDNLSVEEIADAIRKGPIPTCMSELTSRAETNMVLDSGYPDDLSAIIFRGTR